MIDNAELIKFYKICYSILLSLASCLFLSKMVITAMRNSCQICSSSPLT